MTVAATQLGQDLPRSVGASVVYIDDLVRHAETRENVAESSVELDEAGAAAVDRDDYAEINHPAPILGAHLGTGSSRMARTDWTVISDVVT